MTAAPVTAGPKRRYDNTRRRELAALTRERIVASGAELLRRSSIRDWRAVTIRAVAERAGVTDRTVYRHFANEEALRDAVMHHLERQVGVDLADLGLGDIADAAARVFRHIAGYPRDAAPVLDPTLAEANRRQHDALLSAVKAQAAKWPAADRTLAAAMLDLMWAVSSYERLVRDWNLDTEEAVRGMSWVVGLVEQAIRDGRRPPKRAPRV
ncbi:MAG TPA: helix-turn-helix domain-containing protein [Acidimicrobiales bacterium]|nr:helix-turn-helix domain-containing protein [Acidimicrobiales bacterium]